MHVLLLPPISPALHGIALSSDVTEALGPPRTGTDRLSFIPIRSSEHIRFYQAFYAIIFDAAELSHGPNYSGGLLW